MVGVQMELQLGDELPASVQEAWRPCPGCGATRCEWHFGRSQQTLPCSCGSYVYTRAGAFEPVQTLQPTRRTRELPFARDPRVVRVDRITAITVAFSA